MDDPSSILSMPIHRWIITGIALTIVKFALDKTLSIRAAFARIKDCPGRVVLWVNPVGAISLVLGPKFPRPGMGGCWSDKFSLYKKLGVTSFASVDITTPRPVFWLADSEALKLVSSERHTFQKNVDDYEMINIYGGNVVSAEGSDWKRHRSVTMSAFNEANTALVWSETLRVMSEWFTQLDATGSEHVVNALPTMTQATLFVISAAGFGRRISWATEVTEELPSGCKLTFQSAVVDSVTNIIFNALVPRWFYPFSSIVKVPYLSSRALSVRLAFDDLRIHMLDLVASARANIMSGKPSGASGTALLHNLVEANMVEDGSSKRLTEGELLSNIFAFLLAGHETSAHTLCFTLVLLALHPDSQRKLYEEVTQVWPADTPVSQLTENHKEYMDKLEYAMACIREALRTFPVEPRITKIAHRDAVLPGTYFAPGSKAGPSTETAKFSMPVPAGSFVILDIWGMHMNPLYWGEDAAEFKPERFIDTESYQWPRHAFTPFSLGARSCLGQRFAYTQMTGILASVVRRYEIMVPDDLAHEPFEVQKEALTKWATGVALTPLNARVKLRRRV